MFGTRTDGSASPPPRTRKERAVTAIGFVGFGEVPSRFAPVLHAHGAQICAYDVVLDKPDGRKQLEQRAGATPVELLPLPALVARPDLVISAVTTDVALAAARACTPHLRS